MLANTATMKVSSALAAESSRAGAAEAKVGTRWWFSAPLALFINIPGGDRMYLPQTVWQAHLKDESVAQLRHVIPLS